MYAVTSPMDDFPVFYFLASMVLIPRRNSLSFHVHILTCTCLTRHLEGRGRVLCSHILNTVLRWLHASSWKYGQTSGTRGQRLELILASFSKPFTERVGGHFVGKCHGALLGSPRSLPWLLRIIVMVVITLSQL